jgi:hypothetical protein
MSFWIKFCLMGYKLGENVKEKIASLMKEKWVAYAQEQVPAVSNYFAVFSSYSATSYCFNNTS